MKIKKNKEQLNLKAVHITNILLIIIVFLGFLVLFLVIGESQKRITKIDKKISTHNHVVETNIEVTIRKEGDDYIAEVVTHTPEPTVDENETVAEGYIGDIYITQGTANKYNKLKKIGKMLVDHNHPNVQEKEGVVMLKDFEQFVSFIKEINRGKCCYSFQAEQFYEKDGKYILQYRVHVYEKKRKPFVKENLMHYYTYRIFKFDTIQDYWKMKEDYPSFGIYDQIAWDSNIKKYVVIGYNDFRYWEKQHNKYFGGIE